MITVEQIVNTQKTNVDTFFGLSGKAFEGVEKLDRAEPLRRQVRDGRSRADTPSSRCPPRTRKSWSRCRRA